VSDRYELLTADRINWSRFVALGGDIDTVRREAIAHGDHRLARLAKRAQERRQ
jgi:hypothetical protein